MPPPHILQDKEKQIRKSKQKSKREREQYNKAQEDKTIAEQNYERNSIENLNDKTTGDLFQGVFKIVGIASIEQSLESKEKQYKYLNDRKMKDLKMKMEKEGKEEQAHESMTESIAEQQYAKQRWQNLQQKSYTKPQKV